MERDAEVPLHGMVAVGLLPIESLRTPWNLLAADVRKTIQEVYRVIQATTP